MSKNGLSPMQDLSFGLESQNWTRTRKGLPKKFDDADEAAANAAAAAQVDAEMQVDDGAGVGLDDSVENL